MTEAVISIDGMSCMHCVTRVQKAIGALAGVEGVNVAVGTASVRFDESLISLREIEETIVGAGYKIRH